MEDIHGVGDGGGVSDAVRFTRPAGFVYAPKAVDRPWPEGVRKVCPCAKFGMTVARSVTSPDAVPAGFFSELVRTAAKAWVNGTVNNP